MTGVSIDTVDDHALSTGDESGTAPGDRRFRPDVEGLRAVAIVLVVLYHGGLKVLSGGYVGVDVFFVISGFVITGLLLRERRAARPRSSASTYVASKRIIPAATLVIVATVVATYWVLGVVDGNPTAVDGRWTAVFLANFHFASVGTNYLDRTQPPSPLLNFWSLAVEEQFYLVYPALFVAIAALGAKATFRTRLVIGLVLIIVASFTLSVLQTSSNPTAAYYSPFTRAWELALGALVAAATPWLLRTPKAIAGVLTWLGLGAIVFSAVAFGATTAYPGSLAVIPVLGAGLVIAGGMAAPKWAAESVLGLQPSRWVGRISYSLYLWHWPILIIAADEAGKTSLPFGQNVVWLLLALGLSIISYRLVENPIRHLRISPKTSVALGVSAVLLTVAALSVAISAESEPLRSYKVVPVANAQALYRQVAAATSITKVPNDMEPTPSQVTNFWGGNFESIGCQATASQWDESICTLGDPTAKRLMVVYGDSHALMWLPVFTGIARSAGWKLVVLGKTACPAELVTVANVLANGQASGTNVACTRWHRWALHWINTHKPNLLVITQESLYDTPATASSAPELFTPDKWRSGLTALLQTLQVPSMRTVFLGDIPVLPESGPHCLAGHPDDAQACSASINHAVLGLDDTEKAAITGSGAEYVDTTPWFCSTKCTAIIDKYCVYRDLFHIDSLWAIYLQNVLADSIGIPERVTSVTLPVQDE